MLVVFHLKNHKNSKTNTISAWQFELNVQRTISSRYKCRTKLRWKWLFFTMDIKTNKLELWVESQRKPHVLHEHDLTWIVSLDNFRTGIISLNAILILYTEIVLAFRQTDRQTDSRTGGFLFTAQIVCWG